MDSMQYYIITQVEEVRHTVVSTFVIGCLCFLGEGGGASPD